MYLIPLIFFFFSKGLFLSCFFLNKVNFKKNLYILSFHGWEF